MNIQWLLGWWNLIFVVPFLLALLYLGIYTLSGWTFGETDADGDFAADHDADLSHDIFADADHDIDSEAAHDTDHDTDANDGNPILAALSWLGVGRVPLSILLMVLLLTWGAAGFFANQLLRSTFADPARLALVSIGAALVIGVLVTRGVTAIVAKYLPTNESYARRRHELLGAEAEALFDVNETFGMACGRDDRGAYFQVPCRVEPGTAAIPKGTKLKLVSYTASDQSFTVIAKETKTIHQVLT